MKTILRNYRDENDYWRIRQFLREVMSLNNLREFCWSVPRLDYWRFFWNECSPPLCQLA